MDNDNMHISTYKGSKRRAVDSLVPLFDWVRHKVYVEPFGGMAAILVNKCPVERMIYNDNLYHNFFVLNAFANDKIYPLFLEFLFEWSDYSEQGFDTLWQYYYEYCGMYLEQIKGFDNPECKYIEQSFKDYYYSFGNKKKFDVEEDLSIMSLDLELFRDSLSLYGENDALLGKLASIALLLQGMSYQGDINRRKFRNSDIQQSLQNRILRDFDFIYQKLSGIEVYCCDALQLIDKLGLLANEDVLIYCDPPYVGTDGYKKGSDNSNISFDINKRLVDMILNAFEHKELACKIAISGYENDILNELMGHNFEKIVLQMQVNSLKREVNNSNEDVDEILWHNL